ncbi:hypothetical protein LSCM4_03908 [Leishmania orientalis]|uniref:Uncharacterized protein n=1 Tax=Leishmania orientalis TaxID=2249476 RepID=A0A836G419_9TRYP|nr:hypothetical protein LSCM4_03908 [Leishmania orientalis]
MDVPRRLRLAYASCLDDVYCERRPVRCNAQPLPRGSPYINEDAELDGRHWLSSLVALVGSNQSGAASLYADPAVNVSFPPPVVATACVEASASPAPHNTDLQLPRFFEQEEAASQSVAPSPRPRDDIRAGPQPPRTESQVDDTQPQSPHTSPLNSSSRTARSPPASPLKSHAQGAARVESAVQTSVAAEAEADTAARVSEELAGTHEALLADVTAALERRVRECVLKTVALDDARQQLICAFQIPSATSPASSYHIPHPVPLTPLATVACQASAASPPAGQWTEQEAHMRPITPTSVATGHVAASGEVVDGPAQAPAARSAATDVAAPLPWLSANRSDASLSDDVKKEMALHLYALRRQVQQLHSQLEAHESTHYRHVNALRAAQKQSRTSSSLPVRVEIVKAYEDDPVPYRKGPWREADFAAARRGGPDRSAGSMKEEDTGDESYTSDDFTQLTSAASSVMSTDDGSSSSSFSSAEELFRQRQAAALRARSQQAATRGAAVNAASSRRSRVSNNSSGDSGSSARMAMTTGTNSDSSLTATTTTSTDDDSDSG